MWVVKELKAWRFPLPRTHTGMLLGNGTMGVMVWGESRVLRLTVGRADFWDHRGGIHWDERMSFANIRRCLEQKDERGLWALFSKGEEKDGQPGYPTILPLGRIELDFGKGWTLTTGALRIGDGTAWVELSKGGRQARIGLVLDMESPLLAVQLPPALAAPKVRCVPAWEYVGERLKAISFAPPVRFASKTLSGWVQARPADPPLCLGYRRTAGKGLVLTALYGKDNAEARRHASARLDAASREGFAGVTRRAGKWWKAYWKTVPTVEIPNERLAFLYDYGMYKLAGLTNPSGVPATLQGPWVEEYQMPPWACDYHFNINVQMCYWPAYHGNRLENLEPLFRMIGQWTERLRHNARCFLGIEDGLMLPHAVDDRCVCIGGYWAGSLDHGCTAWVAQMMYRYYRYTMNAEFLRRTAYPFMAGAMRVYEGMLERRGDSFVLPLSVSPEYTAKSGAHSGANASFQWACMRRLCEDLVEAARALGETPKPLWQEILEKAPRACLVEEHGEKMIAVWEGVNLEETHRHHSHLAGIVPFDIFDFDDPEWQKILHASLNRWIVRGPGLWSGWCVPWAAMIHARFGKGEASEMLLESWQRVFTNEGHGTLHDAHIPGFTLFGAAYGRMPSFVHRCSHEIMQMDAGMSATAAIQEMLLHTRRGVNYLFAGAPQGWREAAFRGMRTDGAFLVSASRENGRVALLRVESPAGGIFALANPWDGPVRLRRNGRPAGTARGAVLRVETARGDTLELTPAAARGKA